MKFLLSLISLFLCSQMMTAQISAEESSGNSSTYIEFVDAPSLTFMNSHIDLGTIERGDKKEMEFYFVNNGNEDIKIEIVSGCECTTLDWPRLPIKVGETGHISAIFDSTEKEKSETVDIDINLENSDPKTGYPMFVRVQYTFEF